MIFDRGSSKNNTKLLLVELNNYIPSWLRGCVFLKLRQASYQWREAIEGFPYDVSDGICTFLQISPFWIILAICLVYSMCLSMAANHPLDMIPLPFRVRDICSSSFWTTAILFLWSMFSKSLIYLNICCAYGILLCWVMLTLPSWSHWNSKSDNKPPPSLPTETCGFPCFCVVLLSPGI